MFQIDARPGGLPRYTLAEEVECLMFISDEARKCAVFVGYKKSNGEYAFAGTAFFVSHIVTEQGSSFLGDEGYGFSYLVTAKHVIDGIRKKGVDTVYLRMNYIGGKA